MSNIFKNNMIPRWVTDIFCSHVDMNDFRYVFEELSLLVEDFTFNGN